MTRLEEFAQILAGMDRMERLETLISLADRFRPVDPSISARPHDERHRVPGCESEAFVFAQPRDDGSLDFAFDVLNPQGISAMAMAVLLQENLSGVPSNAILTLNEELVFDLFGRELSMGKSMGLMGMLRTVKALAAGAIRIGP
ncbi:MAG TPA: SufE family protein [Fimbriimonadaceae bacterium]|nr:SufE family protein [Fimbriimonadaceae bacterium]HRJ33497.1 SufE family protein [Fimbriimonadaceae bacterium]